MIFQSLSFKKKSDLEGHLIPWRPSNGGPLSMFLFFNKIYFWFLNLFKKFIPKNKLLKKIILTFRSDHFLQTKM